MLPFSGCTEKASVPVVIFDTDMGNDVDDALALDMLYKYADAGKIDLAAIMLTKEGPAPIGFLDVMGTWYGYPDIPVGVIRDGADCGADSLCYLHKVLDMKAADGSPLFARTHSSYDGFPEAIDLYRKTLSEAQDSSVTIVSVGFFTNLARLLETGPDKYSRLSGKDLVRKKVKKVYAMAGSVADTSFTEYNIVTDVPSAQKFFSGCPVPVAIAPFELGCMVRFPASCIENDFSWTSAHPLVEAYKSYLQMPYDREVWDLTAVLAAVEGDAGYFSESPAGTVTVKDSGAITFLEGSGNMSYLYADTGQAEKMGERFVSLVVCPPASAGK